MADVQCMVGPICFLDTPESLKVRGLRLAMVCGHQVVVGDHYDAGVLGFHIPDGAVVPQKILEEMWLWNHETGKGRLGGKRGDRVKRREIEGVTSNGLFYGARYWVVHEKDGPREYIDSPSWRPEWYAGKDVAEEVGIKGQE